MSEPLTTLYVGIDVSKNSNQVCALNFDSKKFINSSFKNNQEGALELESKLVELSIKNDFKNIIIVLESTGVFSYHIANYLSSSHDLLKFETTVYVVNAKMVKNYGKSFIDTSKTDPKDAFILADFARVGRCKELTPYRGSQRLALQRLLRHRKHLVELSVREKEYVTANVFIKFSEFNNGKHGYSTFSNYFSNTAIDVLLKYKSTEQIAKTSIEDLANFIIKSGKNRFSDSKEVAKTLQAAARASYRLDKAAHKPINLAIASSIRMIEVYDKEIDLIDKQIELLIKGLDNQSEYKSLISIPGLGPVFAAGILSEVGSIKDFDSDSALAKYIGLTWKDNQSGEYESEHTPMQKAGNTYLRYYVVEAANSVRQREPEYQEYYQKKYAEVKIHQHPRAVVLTARKLVRLIYTLASKDQLYSPKNNRK